MDFLKKCSVGEIFVAVYQDKETKDYVVTSGLEVDQNFPDEEVDMLMNYYSDLIEGDATTPSYERAVEEMQERIIYLLNNYFEEPSSKSVS